MGLILNFVEEYEVNLWTKIKKIFSFIFKNLLNIFMYFPLLENFTFSCIFKSLSGVFYCNLKDSILHFL